MEAPFFVEVNILYDQFCVFFSSSMFFDEDGDLAHEFYEETIVTKNGRKKAKLKRIQKNLTPQVRKPGHVLSNASPLSSLNPLNVVVSLQGIIKLDHPCIHVDFPVVLCEA